MLHYNYVPLAIDVGARRAVPEPTRLAFSINKNTKKPMKTDIIFIHGLKIQTIIGCLPQEKEILQSVILDIDMFKDLQVAAQHDDINATVSYAQVVENIRTFVEQSRFALLETLAEQLTAKLLNEFPIQQVTLKIQKPQAIVNVPNVGVIITRTRDNPQC